METISRLARRFGLSRSTLLHYDRIGLLRAPARSGAGYRRYGAEAARRLERICLYRSAGVPLAEIRRILDGPREGVAAALERRLVALREELARLRAQQDVIVRVLQRPDLPRRYRGLESRRLGGAAPGGGPRGRHAALARRLRGGRARCPLGAVRFLGRRGPAKPTALP